MALAAWENWAGTLRVRTQVHRPKDIDDVVRCVRGARRIHVVGAGHSFAYPTGPPEFQGSESVDSDFRLLDLTESMNKVISVTRHGDSWSCEVQAGCTLGHLATELERHDLALETVPSLLCVTIAGVVLSGTHGSGLDRKVFADLVEDMTLVNGNGDLCVLTKPADFLHLGLLGVVTQLTIRCVPFYKVQQLVYEDVPLSSFLMDWRQVVASGDSVALWIDLCSGTLKVWVRNQLSVDRCAEAVTSGCYHSTLIAMGGSLRLEPMRILETDAFVSTTKVGSWHEILPYFPVGVDLTHPVSVQAEFFVALSDFPAAIAALRALPRLSELLPQGSEVRFVRGDRFALSPCHERFSPAEPLYACIHFTLLNDPLKVPHIVAAVEKALRPFSARTEALRVYSLAVCSHLQAPDRCRCEQGRNADLILEDLMWLRGLGAAPAFLAGDLNCSLEAVGLSGVLAVAGWRDLLAADALAPVWEHVMDKNGIQYSSTDTRAGVDVDQMLDYSEALIAPMCIDDRGGYFDHLDVAAAVNDIMTSKKWVSQSRRIARTLGLAFESMSELFALKLRVMCAHVRTKFKDCHCVMTAQSVI
ncbi:unnamed protein product [Prorocentrum cordatum]|uniref:FAD-binding PCMH-type domain-containing protein n=1 Tax=Prorocentrum cordatum TaxID=2364126 RepID=A0ABN9QS98_9DINO|nr:unnamed protein product [Polarella glacialis]